MSSIPPYIKSHKGKTMLYYDGGNVIKNGDITERSGVVFTIVKNGGVIDYIYYIMIIFCVK